MSRGQDRDGSRRLLDHLAGPRELGTPEALFATTFDLTSSFVELDFLPTVLGVTTWDDYSAKGRLELEQQLALIGTVAIAMEGRRLQGRPRSLRVHLTPATAQVGGVLHAKVTLIVHEDSVRLLVGSANLTEGGYRHNREVAICVTANRKRPEETRLIAQALDPLKTILETWWNNHIETVVQAAKEKLSAWPQSRKLDDDQFLWSAPGKPLWREFLALWPEGEAVKEIHIVSPFWSAENGRGPIGQFLQGLRERDADFKSTTMRLITAAERDTSTNFCPSLPKDLASFDFRTLGVEATAAAANPKVDSEDVGRDDIERERALHAKVVLVVGTKSSLAYIGSANFTVPGWGFGTEQNTNIEAGIVLLRRGKARDALRAILPATCRPVVLDGSSKGLAFNAREADEDPGRPYPSFLRSVELCPSATVARSVELVVCLHELPPGHFKIEIHVSDDAPNTTLLDVGACNSLQFPPIALSPEIVRELMRQRAVIVTWIHGGESVQTEFPLNVSQEVRDNLPFADPAMLPREGDLIAFYQGRIELADVFPETNDDADSMKNPVLATGSNVDTSDILSYQIREFVEALPGIRQELERSVTTPAMIRLAFLGPVSPVALAREIAKSVAKGRSTTAAAFQLVELLACVRSAEAPTKAPERVAAAWADATHQAEVEIRRLYGDLKTTDGVWASNSNFRRYEQLVIGSFGGAS